DENGVLAQAFGARSALRQYLLEDWQRRLRVHLHQSLEGSDAHVVVLIGAAALRSELRRLFSDSLRRSGITAAGLGALDPGAQCLRIFASRGLRVVARLKLDRVDGVMQITLTAELIE